MNNVNGPLQRVLDYCDGVYPSTASDATTVSDHRLSTITSILETNFDSIKQEDKQKIIAKLNERIERRKEKEGQFCCLTLLIQRIVNFIILRGFATTAERAERMAVRLGNFDPVKKEFWQNKVHLSHSSASEEYRNTICESLACFPSIETTYFHINAVDISGSASFGPILGCLVKQDFTPQNSLVIWIIRSQELRSQIERKIMTPEYLQNLGVTDEHIPKHTHCFLDESEYQEMKKNPRLLPKNIYYTINNKQR